MSVSSKKIFHLLPLVKQLRLLPLVKQIENSTVANSTPPLFKSRQTALYRYKMSYVLNLYVDKE